MSAVIPLGKVSVGVTLKYRGEIQDTKTTKTKAYTVIDTQISYDMTANLQANVSIYNLQNRTYFPLNDYQAPGREILAGIIYSF